MILNLTGKKAQIACGLLCCCSMAYAQSNDNSEVVLLHTGWEFSQAGTELWRTAEVPGTVHQDLIHHKLLPSPFYGMNEPVSYTHLEEAKELVAFCKAHHMTLIPEIDMPGHSAAFIRCLLYTSCLSSDV